MIAESMSNNIESLCRRNHHLNTMIEMAKVIYEREEASI